MKPLVYYCRWQNARLRLQGRDETAVWGQLLFVNANGERTQNFRFHLKTWELSLEGEPTVLLDEMGVRKTVILDTAVEGRSEKESGD